MNAEQPCPKCGCYNGKHDFECEHLTLEGCREALRGYIRGWKEQHELISDLRSQLACADQVAQSRVSNRIKSAESNAQFWHGKYAIVKTENNALRKKLFTTTV